MAARQEWPGPQVEIGKNSGRHVRDPPSDRRIALHPGNDCGRGQRQNSGDQMFPALAYPAI